MGVDRTSYLLYGFKVEDEDKMKIIDVEHYEDLMEEEPYSSIFNNVDSDQTIISDAMCGEYIYVGLKLAEIDEYDDNETVELSIEELTKLNDKLKKAMKEWPDYLVDLFKDDTPKLYFFIHAY